MDMIGADESAAQVTDKIKDLLYAKSGEKIDAFRPYVANSLFGNVPETEDDIQLQKDVEGYSDTIAGTDREEPELESEPEGEE